VSALFLVPLALVGGVMDAVGGGGWGPVGTTTLLSSGRVEPRRVVGSIDTFEFLVAMGASLGFLLALGRSGINVGWVLALLIGGVLAAPVAAYLVRHLPARILGVAAGGVIVLTNAKTILELFGASGILVAGVALAWLVVWAQMLVLAVQAGARQPTRARRVSLHEGCSRSPSDKLGTCGSQRSRTMPSGR
jgi:hypothetical protein